MPSEVGLLCPRLLPKQLKGCHESLFTIVQHSNLTFVLCPCHCLPGPDTEFQNPYGLGSEAANGPCAGSTQQRRISNMEYPRRLH
jgi:hypothetical protein